MKETEHLTPKPREQRDGGDGGGAVPRETCRQVPKGNRTHLSRTPCHCGERSGFSHHLTWDCPSLSCDPIINSALTWHLAFSDRLVRHKLWGPSPGGPSQKFHLAEDTRAPSPYIHPSLLCAGYGTLVPAHGRSTAPRLPRPLKLHSAIETRISMLLRNPDSL